jgi:hypothetical protein
MKLLLSNISNVNFLIGCFYSDKTVSGRTSNVQIRYTLRVLEKDQNKDNLINIRIKNANGPDLLC